VENAPLDQRFQYRQARQAGSPEAQRVRFFDQVNEPDGTRQAIPPKGGNILFFDPRLKLQWMIPNKMIFIHQGDSSVG
jgi:hypothetical protein